MPDMSNFTSVFRAQSPSGNHRIAKRRRPALSCRDCKLRKLKCDRRQPCMTCIKRGAGESCTYAARREVDRSGEEDDALPTAPPKSSSTKTDAGSAPRHEVQSRLFRLESMVQGLVQKRGDCVEADAVQNSLGSEQMVTPSSQEDPLSDETCFPVHGYGNTPYHGPTHWAAVLDHIREIQTVLSGEDNQAEAQPSLPPSETQCPVSPDMIFGNVDASITMEEIIRSLPSRQRADALLSVYFGAKFIAAPFIHVPRFQRQYEAFWADPSSASMLWISMLFSILCSASAIAGSKGQNDPETNPRGPPFYVHKSVQCLVAGHYLTDAKYAIEALLLQATCRHGMSKDSNTLLWSIFGLATRLAQRQGYHRDPRSLPGRRISPFEAEIRRRVWFFIEAYDVLLSSQLGMPPIVHEGECDTASPGNYADDDFDETTVVMPRQRPPLDATPALYYQVKSKLCRIARKVVRHAMQVSPPDSSLTSAIDAELRDWKRQLPPCLENRPIRSSNFGDPNHVILHRLTIELMYRKSLCVLHRPSLVRDKQVSGIDKHHAEGAATCRESALIMLDLHREYSEEIQPGGRLHEERSMLSSLALHNFLIAAMVICLDLHETRDPSANDHEKKMEALQASCDIWTDRAASSLDAKRASIVLQTMIRRLRQQATNAQEARDSSSDLMRDFALSDFDWGSLVSLDGTSSDSECLDWVSTFLFLHQHG